MSALSYMMENQVPCPPSKKGVYMIDYPKDKIQWTGRGGNNSLSKYSLYMSPALIDLARLNIKRNNTAMDEMSSTVEDDIEEVEDSFLNPSTQKVGSNADRLDKPLKRVKVNKIDYLEQERSKSQVISKKDGSKIYEDQRTDDQIIEDILKDQLSEDLKSQIFGEIEEVRKDKR